MAGRPTYEELQQRVRELERTEHVHKQAMESLKVNEERLSSFLYQASDAFYLLDQNLNFIEINKRGLEIIGRKRDEVIGRNIADVVPDVRESGRYEQHLEVIRTGKAFQIQDFFPHPIFGPLCFILKSFKVGEGIGFIATDITERKRTEEALKKSEEKYHAIFDQAADSIVLVEGETGALVEFNEMAHKNLGYTREEFEKIKISDFEAIESDEEVAEHIKNVIKEGTDSFETKHRTKRGKMRHIHVSSRAISILGKDFVQSIWSDITDHKRMEESLRYSKERYQALSDATFESVLISEKGILTDVNKVATEMFGYNYDEFIGMPATDLSIPEYREFVERNILSGYEEPYETIARRKDGSTFYAEIRGKMTRYRDKGFRMAVLRDIDTRKRAEEVLHKAHDELEAKIKERTSELEKSKSKLTKEIERHKKTERILRKREKDLESKTDHLEELNAALNVLLDKREEDKIELQDNFLSNVKGLIQPYVDKLKQSSLSDSQKTLTDILESNLNEIVSPFTRKLSSKLLNLSPAEIQVANLVKLGKTNKEIAEMSHVTERTIAFHRENIRKKLGIKNQKTNLKTYLMSLD